MPPRRLALSTLLALAVTAAVAAEDAAVTIYRCTDAAGKLTLRDSPCAKGQQQQVRSMVRPKDAPTVAPPAPPRPAASAPAPIVIVRNAPRPLYECVRPDGSAYTAETDAGAPRWVPLWTLDYPVTGGGLSLGDRIGAPAPRPPGDRPGTPRPPRPGMGGDYVALAGAGTWVRDECHPLPQAEVCDRLVDRRDVIRRRAFNAMPSERATLGVEERGISARLADDCGVR